MEMSSVNSDAPLVSVVIPTYSRSDMLTRALESVNAQTYPNIEIVVVDDNGKGTNQQLETQTRVLAFETRPGVELHYVVREKNGGGSLARNTGIDASKADFVAFLDDDDEFLPRKLELQMEPMSDSNVSLTYAHCKGVQPDGTEIYYRRVCNGVPVFEQAYCGCIAATSQWLARKDALRSVGCFSDTPAKQDSILMFKLLIACFQIRCVPEVLSVYYDDLGTVRISTSGKSLAGELNYDRLIREYSGMFTLNQRRRVEHAMHYRVGMMLVGMNASAEGAVQLLSSFALAPFAFIHKAYRVVGHNAKQALKKLNAHRG